MARASSPPSSDTPSPSPRNALPVQRATKVTTARTNGRLAATQEQVITARLAAAGSRRMELESLLRAAPWLACPATLRSLVVEDNVTSKTAAASRLKVWRQLKEKYVLDPALAEYRAFAATLQNAPAPSDRGLILYLMLARTDRLLRELVLAGVVPHLSRPGSVVDAGEVQWVLEQIVGPKRGWSLQTMVTIRQHALSALRDFGVLTGGTKKRIANVHPGPHVTLFAARLAALEGLTARQTLSSPWFRLLGRDTEGTWALLHVAASDGVLRCRRQADVVELELPPLPKRSTV